MEHKYIRHVCYIALPRVIEESLDEIRYLFSPFF